MRDASLDDFLSGTDEATEEDEHESEAEPADVESESESEAEAEPGPEAESETEAEPETDTETETEQESDTEPVSDTADEPEGPPPVADVEPARSTYAWSPDGATCAECGEQVEERWESEAGLVCVECKEW